MEKKSTLSIEILADTSKFEKSVDGCIEKLNELAQRGKQVDKTLIDTINYRRRSAIKNFLINLIFLLVGCMFGAFLMLMARVYGPIS